MLSLCVTEFILQQWLFTVVSFFCKRVSYGLTASQHFLFNFKAELTSLLGS